MTEEEALACGEELTRQSWEQMQLRVLRRACLAAGMDPDRIRYWEPNLTVARHMLQRELKQLRSMAKAATGHERLRAVREALRIRSLLRSHIHWRYHVPGNSGKCFALVPGVPLTPKENRPQYSEADAR